jgi:hypothetical protein
MMTAGAVVPEDTLGCGPSDKTSPRSHQIVTQTLKSEVAPDRDSLMLLPEMASHALSQICANRERIDR